MSVPTGQRIVRDKIITDIYRREGATATAGQTWTSGWHLMRSAAGTAQVATEVPGLLSGGFADRDLVTADTGNNDFVNLWAGIYAVDQSALSGDAFTATSGPAPIYAIDNQLFGASPQNPSTGAQRSIAGLFLRLDRAIFTANANNKAIAWIGPEGVAMASALQASQGANVRDRVRGVLTALGGTATFANGIMTGPANTAIGTQDGVTTVAVGDVWMATKGMSGLPAAAQAGPWQFIALGSGSSQWVAIRPWWYQTATALPLEYELRVGPEGTSWGNNTWRAFAAPSGSPPVMGNIDTADPLFRPRFTRGTQALSGGTATVSNLWIATGAVPTLVDTTAANAVKGVTTAGDGSGTLVLTGTSTDTIAYQYNNF